MRGATLTDDGLQVGSAVAPFVERGPVSGLLLAAFRGPAANADESLAGLAELVDDATHQSTDPVRDDDLQLSLAILYGLHYGSVVDTDEAWEWHPALIHARGTIERAFEAYLREQVAEVSVPAPDPETIAATLFDLTKPTPGPSVARWMARKATDEQAHEHIVLRSVYTLKEADAQTWAIPRLRGRAKAALVEIQADEYGGGLPHRMHSEIFAKTMRTLGLDDRYGTYFDLIPALTFASFNMMSMFGLNRRLRGATAGHYATYEMTSSIPNRFIGDGFRRLGYGTEVTDYFDEHVEADAVHEQIAGRDLAGGVAELEPHLVPDIMFGAQASLMLDSWESDRVLQAWSAGRSALRHPLPEHLARTARKDNQ